MKYQYFGLFLSEKDRNALLRVIIDNPIVSNLVFQRGSTLYLDHCTLLHSSQGDEEVFEALREYIRRGPFEMHRMTIDGIGFSDKAIAFRVTIGNPQLPCANANPHITVCTIKGGKPVDSNSIVTWIPIAGFDVSGQLKMVRYVE